MVKTEIPKNETEFHEFVLDVVRTLVALIQEKDPFLRKHSERVASNCANFCEEFKIVGSEEIDTIYFAGLLHDIGIVAVPIDMLQRTDPLSDEEMIRIKKHPAFDFCRQQRRLSRHHRNSQRKKRHTAPGSQGNAQYRSDHRQ